MNLYRRDEADFCELELTAPIESGCSLPISIYLPKNYVDQPKTEKHPVIFIYGGSRGFSQKFLNPMKEKLVSAGFGAVSFDFRGMFPFSPDFYQTGLYSRLEDAETVCEHIRALYPATKLTLIGLSMGAHLAVLLAANKLLNISSLILLVPAAYHYAALPKKINFGPEFTELIRKPKSWIDSDAFLVIQNFSGPLLIIKVENDEVIYPEIIDRYYLNAGNIKDRSVVTLKNYTHGKTFDPPDFEKQEKIMSVIIPWLKDRE